MSVHPVVVTDADFEQEIEKTVRDHIAIALDRFISYLDESQQHRYTAL